MSYVLRTHTCGELAAGNVGETVALCGWVQSVRDHGGLIFVDLRDRYGRTQVVVSPDLSEDILERARSIHRESAIRVEGIVSERPEGTKNPSISTGDVEVMASNIEIIGDAAPVLPMEVSDENLANEEVRLRYRYIDLRRPSLQANMMARHRAAMAVRNYLSAQGFLEIQTPLLVRSTPEGARDFVVPSRNFPGKFYALPQSPQLYKQLLMIAGFDRYFQIAPCFRDEDQRADRQLVHSQIDIEMSFCDEEDVFSVVEGIISAAFKGAIGADVKGPFLRMTYDEAMERFGSDKPDMRFGMELVDLTDLVADSEFGIFKSVCATGGRVRGISAPGCAGFSRKQIDDLTELARIYRAKGLITLKVEGGEIQGSVAKHISSDTLGEIASRLGSADGDLILIIADTPEVSATALGHLRRYLGKELGLIPKGDYKLLWVTDFPLFEWNPDDGRWDPMHHIFTMPREGDLELLESDPASVKGRQYDLVLNGTELGSGSIRINDPAIQKRVMNVIGVTPEEAEEKFGFLLRAYQYGGPIHGGFAIGFDRLLAVMLGLESLRDVIAFPQNAAGVSLVDDCPNEIDPKQWKELHLKLEDCAGKPDAEARSDC
ncbi:MAG TPA: aspartate--tRNA ligase [Bacillota bacterium]|nr:aspartate--tRNA ligase [Bacillota bacterium]HOK70107.1 aspartate--tRNA ligase [Bacillota bacterium]HOL50929.1 aspartate--tRNA ligase [Bacillota bacterium]